MRAILWLLVVAMIAKDTSQLNDPYVLRALSQGACLLAAIGALISNCSGAIAMRYWPIWGYVISLMIGGMLSSQPVFVELQVLSLTSVALFGVMYAELMARRGKGNDMSAIDATMFAYVVVSVGSLAAVVLAPHVAYESLFAGNIAGYQVRFRGLFSKSAMMGAAAGLAVGFALMRIRNVILKTMLCIPPLACLMLTLSRTFWIAFVIASVATIWMYYPRLRTKALICAAAGVIVYGLFVVSGVSVKREGIEAIARVDSITNLTGRIGLWQHGVDAFMEAPFFGYGFTLGSEGLRSGASHESIVNNEKATARDSAKASLHNGYVQSMLDAGLFGTVFYVATVIVAIRRIYQRDAHRKYAPYFFGLVYLSVANVGESVIYSAAVFHSVLFWIIAAFAMSVRTSTSATIETNEQRRPMLFNVVES